MLIEETLSDIFEPFVDAHGLRAVVRGLALLASVKADHILENWQDEPLANEWDMMSAWLSAFDVAFPVLGASR